MNIIARFLSPVQNCEEIGSLICRSLKVSITDTTLNEQLQEHPDYPSLLSISDVLKQYGVDNISLKTGVENLTMIPKPFVAQIIGKEGDFSTSLFSVIYQIDGESVEWFNPQEHRQEVISQETFAEVYNGYIQLYEKGENAGEENFAEKRKKEQIFNSLRMSLLLSIPFFVLFISITAFFLFGFWITLFPFIYTVVTFAGCVVGAILLSYELDQFNPLLDKVCTGGAKTNCVAVLQSKGSKILGVDWSVVGFSYFGGVLFILLLNFLVNNSILWVVGWLSILALPYTVYSIYYQAKIVRQWCPMCLSVQLILVLQFVTALLGGFYSLASYSLLSVISVGVSLFVVFIFTFMLLSALKKAKEGRKNYLELQRLKHNPSVFDALLRKQKEITGLPEELGVVFGNPDAPIKLTKVCNPYCFACRKSHSAIDTLLENNINVRLQVILATTLYEEDPRLGVVRHLLALSKSDKYRSRMRTIFNDWYLSEHLDYKRFAEKYPLSDEELMAQDSDIKAMLDWCVKTEIRFTPTFFVNGFQLPESYDVRDLIYFFSV